MNLSVKLFAHAKDIAGAGSVEIDLPETASVADLRRVLGETIPALVGLIPSLLIAVDNDYADDTVSLSPGCNLACFPPVSGG